MVTNETTRKAAIFVDDGADDAWEFATNYIWFDASDPDDWNRARIEAHALYRARCSRLPDREARALALPVYSCVLLPRLEPLPTPTEIGT